MKIEIKIGEVSFSLTEDLKESSEYSHITKSPQTHQLFINGIKSILEACVEANKTLK